MGVEELQEQRDFKLANQPGKTGGTVMQDNDVRMKGQERMKEQDENF